MMKEVNVASTEKTIDVTVPIRTAYDQWTQFESFPQFMEGVEAVRQLDDKRLEWRAKVAGKTQKWTAEITEQTPDRVIAWRSTSGAENTGRVSFMAVDPMTTRVTVEIGYDPKGVVEKAGDAMGAMDRRVEGDLERFKQFIEERGAETGAWRGEIHGGQVEHGATS
jgi:uncharacterized membrane protein